MRPSDFLWMQSVATLAATIAVTGCGSDDKRGSNAGPSCLPPVLQGSTLGASGTAMVTGTGTLPDGIANGLQLQVEVIHDNVTSAVVPDDPFAMNDVCGKTFHYTVNRLAKGTYRLGFAVFAQNSEKPTYEGQSPNEFTIADGATLTIDTVFPIN